MNKWKQARSATEIALDALFVKGQQLRNYSQGQCVYLIYNVVYLFCEIYR